MAPTEEAAVAMAIETFRVKPELADRIVARKA
jgi:hypothetical protein